MQKSPFGDGTRVVTLGSRQVNILMLVPVVKNQEVVKFENPDLEGLLTKRNNLCVNEVKIYCQFISRGFVIHKLGDISVLRV